MINPPKNWENIFLSTSSVSGFQSTTDKSLDNGITLCREVMKRVIRETSRQGWELASHRQGQDSPASKVDLRDPTGGSSQCLSLSCTKDITVACLGLEGIEPAPGHSIFHISKKKVRSIMCFIKVTIELAGRHVVLW